MGIRWRHFEQSHRPVVRTRGARSLSCTFRPPCESVCEVFPPVISLDCLAAQLGGAGVPAPDVRARPGPTFERDAFGVPGGDEYAWNSVAEHCAARDEVCDITIRERGIACAAIDREQVVLVRPY